MDDASSAGGEIALSDQEHEKFSHNYCGVSSGHPFVPLGSFAKVQRP